MPSDIGKPSVSIVSFYLLPEEKAKFKTICSEYQLSMQKVLRECVFNIIQEENKKYHDLMIDLFEKPYTNPDDMFLLEEEIENIYDLLEQDTSEEE